MANFFPRWSNWLPLKLAICSFVIVCGLTAGTWYYVTPKYTKIGYEPIQPVPFPHDIHVSQLGMDCRYCHSFVETAAHSNVPNTQTCMACHQQVQKDNPKLEPVRASWKTGDPVEWVWIHRLPDYVFYNHAACKPGDQLRELSRTGQSHARDVRRQANEHEMVPRMSPASGEFFATGRSDHQSRLETGGCESGGICRQVRQTGGRDGGLV